MYGYRGLLNRGSNLCYVNSSVQLLNSSPKLTAAWRAGVPSGVLGLTVQQALQRVSGSGPATSVVDVAEALHRVNADSFPKDDDGRFKHASAAECFNILVNSGPQVIRACNRGRVW